MTIESRISTPVQQRAVPTYSLRSGESPASSAISTIRPNVCSRSCELVSSPVTTWSETVQIASARRPYFAASVYSALASISTASTPYSTIRDSSSGRGL